jgi:hypothetical protein
MNPQQRIDTLFEQWKLSPDKKKMFGGVAYMLNGNMSCATMSNGSVVVRLPAEKSEEVLGYAHVQQATMGNRVMKNWALIDTDSMGDAELSGFIEIGRDFALSMKGK